MWLLVQIALEISLNFLITSKYRQIRKKGGEKHNNKNYQSVYLSLTNKYYQILKIEWILVTLFIFIFSYIDSNPQQKEQSTKSHKYSSKQCNQ